MTTASRRAHTLAGIVLALTALALPVATRAEVAVSITIAPPLLPVYVQPEIPGDGYIWTPGYWAYGPDGYFWVPGTWVMPPEVGFLWTPGWWGWSDGFYLFHAGYWGPHIGFYGGVNYGFGYTGHGYEGGYWQGNRFYYNQTVNNVSTTNIRNVYSRTVVNNVTVNNVSYNGGNGGIRAEPNREELAAGRETHRSPTSMQVEHVSAARADHGLLAAVNHGHPTVAASARPAEFSGRGVVAARGAPSAPGEMNSHIAPNRGSEHAAPAPSRSSEPSQRFGQERSGGRSPDASAPATRPAPTYRPAPAQREAQPQHAYQSPQREAQPQRGNPPPVQHAYQPPVQHAYQPPAQHAYQPPAQHAYQPPAQHAYQPPPQPRYQQRPPEPAAGRAAPAPRAQQGRQEREDHPHR